jgi:hypothetical protein
MTREPAPFRPPSPSENTSQLRRGELFLWFVWALGTLLLSINVIGEKLVLIYVYGWHRVITEHLHILHMPKGRPWPLSNGEFFNHTALHFIFSLVCWFALFLLTYPFVRRLLPPQKL